MQWSLTVLSLMGQCSFLTCQLHRYHFIGENKTWDEAQKYCREKYTDLATVSNMTDMKRLLNSTRSQDEAWIGLHSYPGKNNRTWYWSLPGVEFNETQTKWEPGQPNDYRGYLENCALISKSELSDYPCTHQTKFICYDVAAPLKQCLVRLKLSVDDPSVDMKDPAVTESMLKQLEEKFREKGVSVKLSWRKLPEIQNSEQQALEQCAP